MTRISILIVYLHKKIQESCNEKNTLVNGIRTEGKNGFKLLSLSNNLREIIGEEVQILNNGEDEIVKNK